MANTDAQPGPTRRVLTWLRAGYPTGVPRTDYAPLLTLLHHRLSPEEIESIAADLSAASAPEAPISEDEIVAAIRDHTRHQPDEAEVERVRAHLAMSGSSLTAVEDEVAQETTPDEEPSPEDDPEDEPAPDEDVETR